MKRFEGFDWPRVVSCGTMAIAVATLVPTEADAQRRQSLREVTIIGCASCGDGRLLSNVVGLTVTNNGSVYVGDATRPKIRVFSNSGRLLRTGMTEGHELGQAQLPIAIVPTPDSSLYVVDMELARVTRLSRTGDAVSAVELSESPVAVAHRRPYTHIFFATIDYGSDLPISRVWKLQLGDSVPQMVYASTNGFPRRRDGRPATFLALAMTPSGGFAIGEGAYAYRIRVFDEDGAPLRDIERDIDRTMMTDLELERAMERRRLALGRIRSLARLEGGDPGPVAPIQREENFFSADALQYDDRDRLWVKTDRGSGNDTVFDIFEPGGQFIQEMLAGDALGVYDISGNYLAGFGFGRLNSPLIRLYEIPRR